MAKQASARALSVCGLLTLAVACGGQPPQARATARPVASAAPSNPLRPARPQGVLYRDEVKHAVEQGLGRFLQHVELEPSLEDGRFVGFRIVRLVPDSYWHGVDLRPGDVVTRVNGQPIERDIDAYQAFVGLKSAPDLRVSYVRDTAQRQLVFKILDRPAGS